MTSIKNAGWRGLREDPWNTRSLDLNKDGLIDYFLTESVWWPNKMKADIYFQNSRGELTESGYFSQYRFIEPYIKLADVNNDSHEDIIVFDHGSKLYNEGVYTGQAPILFLSDGKGSGSFSDMLSKAYEEIIGGSSNGIQYTSSVSAKYFDIGDIDNDGDLDLWVESSGGKNISNHFLRNDGNKFTVVAVPWIDWRELTGPKSTDFFRYHRGNLVDINNDGFLDLVLGQQRDADITHVDQSSQVFLNQKNWKFKLHQVLPRPQFNDGFTQVKSIVQADFNNDGTEDLLLAHQRIFSQPDYLKSNPLTGNYFQILIADPESNAFTDLSFSFLGSQAAWNSTESTNWSHVAFIKPEDINNDGYVDILISYRGESKEKEAPTVLINLSGKELLPYQLAGNNNENFVISGEGNTLKYKLFSNGSIIEKYINARPEVHLEKGKRKVVMYTDRSHLASEQSDVISGDFLPDYVQLMGGNDKFMGGIGGDRIYGNRGKDLLYGNEGPDSIYGNMDEDIIYGGKDADLIYGNLDNDKLYGNMGADYLYGGQGDDVIYAGQGNDFVYGNKGNDTLYGNKGADTFVCTKGFDVIKDFWGLDGDKILVSSVTSAVISEKDGSTLVTSSEGQLLLEGFARQFFDESQYLI